MSKKKVMEIINTEKLLVIEIKTKQKWLKAVIKIVKRRGYRSATLHLMSGEKNMRNRCKNI